MALTRLNNNAYGETISVAKGGTGVTTAADLANTGNLVKLSSQTASGDASIEFTSGIDSTYKIYHFEFNEINLATDGAEWCFQSDTGTNTSYNQTTTSTMFHAENSEAAGGGSLTIAASRSADQSTSLIELCPDVGSDADHSLFGFFRIQNPSSTTFAKQFSSRCQSSHQSDLSLVAFVDGYINTTTAITRFKFAPSSGNFDGTITMYGVNI